MRVRLSPLGKSATNLSIYLPWIVVDYLAFGGMKTAREN
jgi:hypothetical protein